VDVSGLSVAEVLKLHGETLAELRRRGVIRTANAPAGDLAELLVARATGGDLADNSQKSWDVWVDEGRGMRLQVKARLVDDMNVRSKRQLSPFRTWDFDAAVIVLFDADYVVQRASKVPVDALRAVARWRRHVNGDVVLATNRLLDKGDDWTEKLRAVVL
jgi:hypothetical protein